MVDYTDMLIQLRTELANVRIREQQILEAIGTLDRLNGQGVTFPSIDPENPRPFAGVTLGEAAVQVLATRPPLGTRDLAELLLNGGARTRSRNFVATLYTALYKDCRFVLMDKKWRLRTPEAPIAIVVQ